MANSPNPLNKDNLTRATIIGTAMATGGILLFLILYVVLGNAGFDALSRVIVALCVPPGLMALAVGGYFLWGRRQESS